MTKINPDHNCLTCKFIELNNKEIVKARLFKHDTKCVTHQCTCLDQGPIVTNKTQKSYNYLLKWCPTYEPK